MTRILFRHSLMNRAQYSKAHWFAGSKRAFPRVISKIVFNVCERRQRWMIFRKTERVAEETGWTFKTSETQPWYYNCVVPWSGEKGWNIERSHASHCCWNARAFIILYNKKKYARGRIRDHRVAFDETEGIRNEIIKRYVRQKLSRPTAV